MSEGARIARFLGEELELFVVSVPREPPRQAALTAAEREVYELLVAGLSNAEIAAARSRAIRTVANQARAIYRKLGVRGRVELLRKALVASR